MVTELLINRDYLSCPRCIRQQGRRCSAVDNFKWSGTEGGLVRAVEAIFHQRQPRTRAINSETSQIHDNDAISHLGLSIPLLVKS
jgi:hypothetical protein